MIEEEKCPGLTELETFFFFFPSCFSFSVFLGGNFVSFYVGVFFEVVKKIMGCGIYIKGKCRTFLDGEWRGDGSSGGIQKQLAVDKGLTGH